MTYPRHHDHSPSLYTPHRSRIPSVALKRNTPKATGPTICRPAETYRDLVSAIRVLTKIGLAISYGFAAAAFDSHVGSLGLSLGDVDGGMIYAQR